MDSRDCTHTPHITSAWHSSSLWWWLSYVYHDFRAGENSTTTDCGVDKYLGGDTCFPKILSFFLGKGLQVLVPGTVLVARIIISTALVLYSDSSRPPTAFKLFLGHVRTCFYEETWTTSNQRQIIALTRRTFTGYTHLDTSVSWEDGVVGI